MSDTLRKFYEIKLGQCFNYFLFGKGIQKFEKISYNTAKNVVSGDWIRFNSNDCVVIIEDQITQ